APTVWGLETITLANALTSSSSVITVSAVQTINDIAPAPTRFSLANYLTFNNLPGGHPLNVVDGPVVNRFQTTQINSIPANNGSPWFPTLNFANRTFVTVNSIDTGDAITVNTPHAAAGLTGLTVNAAPNSNPANRQVIRLLGTTARVSTTIN